MRPLGVAILATVATFGASCLHLLEDMPTVAGKGALRLCTWSCFRRMRPCGRDGTVKLAVFVLVQALGRWQRMPGPRYLRHFVMEWSGRDRCGGKVRWKEVESEVESSGGWNMDWRVEWRVHCRVEW